MNGFTARLVQTVLLFAAAAAVGACEDQIVPGEDGNDPPATDVDADVDADNDADSDADTDVDADVDTDVDADSDSDIDADSDADADDQECVDQDNDWWCDQFDWVYREYDYAVYTMTIHPDVSGRPQVLLMLERLYEYFASHPGVRFCTFDEIADDFKRRHPRERQATAAE